MESETIKKNEALIYLNMKEFIENLIEKLNDKSLSQESRDLIKEILRKQAIHEQDLLDQINNALRR
jgi:hypothetical protein